MNSEEKIKISDTIFEEIINNSPFAIILINLEGNVIKWNRQAEELFGFSEEEVLGKKNPIILRKSEEEYMALVREVASGSKFENIEVNRLHKNGNQISVRLFAYPLRNNNNTIEAIAGLYCMKETEYGAVPSIKTFEELYRGLSTRIEDIFYSLDKNLSLTFLSINAKNYISDGQYEKISGEYYKDVLKITGLDPETINSLAEILESSIKEKKQDVFSSVDVDLNGKNIHFHIKSRFYYDDTGLLTGVTGLIRDATLIKELEYEVEDKIHSINFLTKNLENVTFYSIVGGNVVVLKNNIFGYEKEKFLNKVKIMEDIVYEDDRQDYNNKFDDWLNFGIDRVLNLEYRIIDNNAKINWVEEHINSDRDSRGRRRISGLILNINDRKEYELRLQESKNLAEEANDMKSALLRNINHELRTPIASILGLTEIIRDEITDESLKERIGLINKAGNRLLSTVNSIINLSLLEASRYELKLDKTELGEIIRNVLDEYRPEAELNGISLEYENKEDVFAFIDPRFFRTIISNLTDNAIKFTVTGGVKISANIKAAENLTYIKVADSGIGISKENLKNIFTEFIKIEGNKSGDYSGIGLGLSVAKKMTELMKGSISVESKVNKGTTFTIAFPSDIKVGKKSAEKPRFIDIERERVPKKMKTLPKVLLVEDNITNKVITTLFLKNICYVDHAIDGLKAIEMAEKKQYDLILMDINLGPGINGIEVTSRIRKKNNYNKIPVVAVTGYAMPGDEEKLLHLGFNYYLAKPFKKDQILEIMKKIFKI